MELKIYNTIIRTIAIVNPENKLLEPLKPTIITLFTLHKINRCYIMCNITEVKTDYIFK